MTDRETLLDYRTKEAKDTLAVAKKLLNENIDYRTIANRAYYSIFYSVLALFLKNDITIKTSKHTGVIAIFDKDFINTGKIDPKFSKIIHKAFKLRQKGDYAELIEVSRDDAYEITKQAEEFIEEVLK